MKTINNSIDKKVFILTTALLVICCMIIYAFILVVMPVSYKGEKEIILENSLMKLASELQKVEYNKSAEIFDSFLLKTGAYVSIQDSKNNVVNTPTNLIASTVSITNKANVYSLQAHFDGFIKKAPLSAAISNVCFADSQETYTLSAYASLQPIDEAAHVLLKLLPYVGIMILIVSLLCAKAYSRFITKPVISISNTAKSMAAMDLDVRCNINRTDEIGDLASSMNELAKNLSSTIYDLQMSNNTLKNDIEREREAEKKRKDFLTAISHELKTPLTIIKGQLEGMLKGIGIYKDRDKYLLRSLSTVDRMDSMVREILEISRMESPDFQIVLDNVNMNSLIKRCIKSYLEIASQKNTHIIENIPSATVYVEADEKLIEKAISNIINNAITHSPEHSEIIIQLTGNINGASLSVENSGVHIDEDKLEELFQPFNRIERSRNRNNGGCGLGLYIVKMILVGHKVDYQIKNTNNGVKFTLYFRHY